MINKMERSFASMIKTTKTPLTPMGQSYVVTRPNDKMKLILKEDQGMYRSGMGSLLYLVKHSHLDISNAVCELAKVMDGATTAHFKDLL